MKRAAAKIADVAAARAQEPFTMVAGVRPKRRPRAGSASAPMPRTTPDDNKKIYTSVAITVGQRECMREEAARRCQLGLASRNDVAAVLRDILDFYVHNREEVQHWVAAHATERDRR